MPQRDTARQDVEAGNSLLGGEKNDNVFYGEAFSMDTEGPCAGPSPVAQSECTYNDRGWAYAFKTSVIITIIAAVFFGSLALEAISADRKHGGWGHRHLSDSRHVSEWLSTSVAGLVLVAVVVGFAMLILHSLINCGKAVVWSSIALVSFTWLTITVLFVKTEKLAPAVVTAAVFCSVARRIYKERARFHFGAITLKVAATAIKSMPGTIFTPLLMVGVKLVWISVSLVAALGSFAFVETVEGSDGSIHRAIHCGHGHSTSPETLGCYCKGEKVSELDCQYSGWGFHLMLLWFVPMLWGCFVIKNVVTCTVSGSVAAWWFSPDDVKPVKAALYRATHYSFGTLCKAAFFVNIASFLISAVRVLLKVVPCASYLFRAALAGVMYLLNYTVIFVGIYGLDLESALHRVREMFARRGMTSLANDSIVNFAIAFLSFSTSFAFAIVMFVMLEGIMDVSPSFQVVATLVFGYIAFVFTIITVLEVVRSAVKAVVVCFIQDPETLKNTRGDELHNELTAAWVKIHPEDEPRDVAAYPMESLNTTYAETH